MQKLQPQDTVVLKEDGTFFGLIERTSAFESPEPLDECLILNYTQVSATTIQDFVLSGICPSGYVFVRFASQEKGSSLVAEDDLILIDRMFDLGDVVRHKGSQLTGTIINVSNSYVLDPTWQPILSSNGFAAEPIGRATAPSQHTCNPSCSPLDPRICHPNNERLIHDVPFSELRRAEDFTEGDWIMQKEWLGIVEETDLAIAVLLENHSIVIVNEPEELFIPIPNYDKPLVSLPEYDGITRPQFVSSMQGWGSVILPEDLECGQFVVTNHRNLRTGRWLRGSFDSKAKAEGHVLMVRCRNLGVQSLICNPLTPEYHWDCVKPNHCLPYENLNTFTAPQEIRRDKSIVLYDPSKHIFATSARTRSQDATTTESSESDASSINLSSNFGVGQKVKFRDPAGAAVKYQGREVDSIAHGRFNRILHSETFGYDLNEFDIVHSQQRATIRWQDGSISEHLSTAINKSTLFENDFMPADIIVARQGMKQKQLNMVFGSDAPTAEQPLLDFNEMTFFEKPHDLFPAKVGIIQSMNPGERVAVVRWYKTPTIRITASGNALGSESRFGPIGEEVEEVSLYEVMTFSGLLRKVRDMVVMAPSTPSERAIEVLTEITTDDFAEVNASITALSWIPDRDPICLLEWMQHNVRNSLDGMPKKTVPKEQYRSHRSLDWVGEICQLRLDGLVVVRINNDEYCQDLIVDHDQILAILDENIWTVDYNDDPMSIVDDESENIKMSDGAEEIISETVEYEGGQRLDDDPGDDNWESDDDLEPDNSEPRANSIAMIDADAREPKRAPRSPDHGNPEPRTSLPPPVPVAVSEPSLASYLPIEPPSAFLSLDREPPPDQFRAFEAPRTSPAFLKRMAKEHKILSTSLPKHEIYVRAYDSRLDLLRCLIIGPRDTPYEYAPFLIDLHLGPGFPREPPTAHFHSWTSGMGRINPNLYEEGKICLSLLGTWPGKYDTEGWTEKATILQLLVSLQGLVFVKAPFYNEAGYEGYEQTNEYTHESFQYSEKAYVMGRNFVKHALGSPTSGLEDVLAWTYLSEPQNARHEAAQQEHERNLLSNIIKRSQTLMKKSEESKAPSQQLGGKDDSNEMLLSGDGSIGDTTKAFLRPLSRGAFVMLGKVLQDLKQILHDEMSVVSRTGRDIQSTEADKQVAVSATQTR